MEAMLIEKLIPLGTGGIFLLILFLSRKEILTVLLAPRADRMSDKLLGDMIGLFSRNIGQVEELKNTLWRIEATLVRSESILEKIKDEAIRGRG